MGARPRILRGGISQQVDTRFKFAGCLVLALCTLHAQEHPSNRTLPRARTQQHTISEDEEGNTVSGHPLGFDEGLSVIAAALEYGHHHRSRLDCSHLVHAIYEGAGFDYGYVNSSELYDGTNEFERIADPQPGDIIVWRGHVGIIVNPAEHGFYSALHSGQGVENYQSKYWRKRGLPRFYRYVLRTPHELALVAGGR